MRTMVDAVVRSAADAATLDNVTGLIEQAHATLHAAPRQIPKHDGPAHAMSVVGGTSHPIAPQLRTRPDGPGLIGTVILGVAYEGGTGLAHGGVLSLLLDHAMSVALHTAGHGAMTVSLEVRYRAPTPLNVPLTVSARLDRVEGRKLHAVGEIAVNGAATVEARGLFIVASAAKHAELFGR